ncbi:MAG TPA: glycosyltransferase [Blastocatellia bacterium]|nr:glycosyltransferase [Blastocatellia bacterium]
MLQAVTTEPKRLRDYEQFVGEEVVSQIRHAAAPFAGARVLHINATAYGGGVAEILQTLVPLMKDLGIDAEWQVIVGEKNFFSITKSFHNALQGHATELTDEMREMFLRNNELNAKLLEGDYDFIIVHDPQPAAMLHYHGHDGGKHWIWRCHIDTSTPYLPVRDFLKPFLLEYDAAIYTMPEYVSSGLAVPNVFIIPPSIDPLAEKNVPMDPEEARITTGRFGIDTKRPLMLQVSRFDPWKDPLGVVDAYRMVKAQIPEVQLALVGSMAADDPEGLIYYAKTLRRAGEDFDVHVLSNLDGVNNHEVNAFQTVADIVIQKSTREGFGLVVAEAQWKGKAVVGGRVGGIPLQIVDGESGFLANDIEGCANACLFLLKNPETAASMGVKGREQVRGRFLSTRHLLDYIKMFSTLHAASPESASSAAQV